MTAQQSPWELSPSRPALGEHEAHIWLINLEAVPDLVGRLSLLLSDAERRRIASLRFERHRRRVTMVWGALRDVLSRYVHLEPERLSFGCGPKGKPMLVPGCGEDTVRFNLSHSGSFGVIAVARGREVGVDIEEIRPICNFEALAYGCFSPAEVQAFFGVPPGQRLRAFFACWTRKEAYLKATGDGLTRRLDEFSVTVDPNGPARLLWVSWDPGAFCRWRLSGLVPTSDTIGAVAISGLCASFRYWQWCPPRPMFGA